jgi:hypothetical protein
MDKRESWTDYVYEIIVNINIMFITFIASKNISVS